MLVDTRSNTVLSVLVEQYIRTGQPVGSKVIAEEARVDVSPATVRHIMAELEEQGFLMSPHTSAGRVPTALGYRAFVNTLQKLPELDVRAFSFRKNWSDFSDAQGLVTDVSHFLSQFTQFASVMTFPRAPKMILRHIKFVVLSARRILAVLVVDRDDVHHRVIETQKEYPAHELEQLSNYLNAHYAGLELRTVRKQLVKALKENHQHMKRVCDALNNFVDDVHSHHENKYMISGEENLFALADENGVEHIRKLYNAFNQKKDVLSLLDRCLLAEDLCVFIGDEAGGEFNQCSVVAAPYISDGHVAGVIGVIGPMRMAYEKVMATVKMTSNLVSGSG